MRIDFTKRWNHHQLRYIEQQLTICRIVSKTKFKCRDQRFFSLFSRPHLIQPSLISRFCLARQWRSLSPGHSQWQKSAYFRSNYIGLTIFAIGWFGNDNECNTVLLRPWIHQTYTCKFPDKYVDWPNVYYKCRSLSDTFWYECLRNPLMNVCTVISEVCSSCTFIA